jgi:hypothetical protein
MASRNRVLVSIAVAAAVIGLGAGVAVALYPSGASSAAPPTAQALTTLVNQLTSADPRVEAAALAPGGAPVRGEPATLLPAGSKLVVEPATWEVTGVDSSGAPAAGRIRARLTEPGRLARAVYLELVKMQGRWLVYETSQA